MKRVPILMLLIMAFVSFATMEGFADNSPPGVEISINYELPSGIEVNIKSQDVQEWQALQKNLLNTGEARIAVNDCDLKFWPSNANSIYTLNNIAQVNSICDAEINSDSVNKNNPENILVSPCNQCRLSVDKNEVLLLFEHSNGDRYAARNAVT